MIIGVLKEPDFEARVSLLSDAVASLVKKGLKVWVETSAGEKAFCSDADYLKADAEVKSRSEILNSASILLSIHPVSPLELEDNLSKILIGVYQPLFNLDLLQEFTKNENITLFSLDMLPRNTRAQTMDVLSSQANIAGYKAVVLAASLYGRYFPMLMTAAGSIAPAKVLILGAGVAGLQAIATAKRLGAVVEVFDTRPAVKEEVQSLGAKFVEVDGAADASKAGGYAVEQTEEYKRKQEEKIAETISRSDIVITTAQIPGKKAPVLVTEEMIIRMRNGSVIIDLAASTGGNTSLTQNNETIHFKGVTIVGASNLPGTIPSDASKLYGRNILNFLQLIIDKENKISINANDELIAGACIVQKGKIINERIKSVIEVLT